MPNALITGASTGIGYSLTKKFAQQGFRVFANVRKEEDAEKLKSDFGELVYPLIFDVTDSDAIGETVKIVSQEVGEDGLDLLVNNAGIAVGGAVKNVTIDEYRHQFDVNVFGLIEVTKFFLPLLGADKNSNFKPGKIINISSTSGKIAFPLLSPYCASKFAVEGFSDSLRREMMLYGIQVIVIGPGPIKTPIWGKSSNTPNKSKGTDYEEATSIFRNMVAKTEKNAMDVDLLADKIFKVYKTRKPKARYTFLNNRFANYTIPSLMPAKILDGIIKKMFKW